MLLSKIYRKAAEILDEGSYVLGGIKRPVYTPEYAMLMLHYDDIDKRSHNKRLVDMAKYSATGNPWGFNPETSGAGWELLLSPWQLRQAQVLGLLLLSEIARDDERKASRK